MWVVYTACVPRFALVDAGRANQPQPVGTLPSRSACMLGAVQYDDGDLAGSLAGSYEKKAREEAHRIRMR